MSTSMSRVEDTYEAQNDQRLDELHTKIRTLRGVTSDIHDDVERQNFMLDETVRYPSELFALFSYDPTSTGPIERRVLLVYNYAQADVTQSDSSIWYWDWKPETMADSDAHRIVVPVAVAHIEDSVLVVDTQLVTDDEWISLDVFPSLYFYAIITPGAI